MTSNENTLRNARTLEEGIPRSTLYKNLRRKEDEISAGRQCGNGRPVKIMTKCRSDCIFFL